MGVALLSGKPEPWMSADGHGSGSGDGSGDGKRRSVRVRTGTLREANACNEQVVLFAETFPRGATWPDDANEAALAGLDIGWAREHFQ